MSKNALIVGVASAAVVIACGTGGAIYALDASSSDSTPSKATTNYELKKEQAKLNGWNQKDGAWYYYKDDKAQAGWVQDSGSWYYCDDSGKMKLNWIQDKSKWYYLGSDGKLRTGWIKDNDKWYYMNNDGTMAVNTTVDGNYINGNGVIEETPKPKAQEAVSSNDGNTKSNNTRPITVEEAKQIALKYLSNVDGGGWENSYFATGKIGDKIQNKYNCYGFFLRDENGDDYDGCICVNKTTRQLYNYNYVRDIMTPAK